MNDYGRFVLECDKYQGCISFLVGRGIQVSRVISGVNLLAVYHNEIIKHKEETLETSGVAK